MTGKVQPGGKQITFRVKEHQITAIVENHAVANVDVLFHEEGEACASKHLHKIGVKGVKTTKDCIRKVLHEYQGRDW